MMLPAKVELLKLLKKIPLGCVASPEGLAAEMNAPVSLVVTMLGQLGEDERELVP